MEFIHIFKKYEIFPFVTTWMNLEGGYIKWNKSDWEQIVSSMLTLEALFALRQEWPESAGTWDMEWPWWLVLWGLNEQNGRAVSSAPLRGVQIVYKVTCLGVAMEGQQKDELGGQKFLLWLRKGKQLPALHTVFACKWACNCPEWLPRAFEASSQILSCPAGLSELNALEGWAQLFIYDLVPVLFCSQEWVSFNLFLLPLAATSLLECFSLNT